MNDTIQELRTRLEESTDRREQIELSLALGRELHRSTPQEALAIGRRILRRVRAGKDRQTLIQLLLLIGRCETTLCNHKEALARLREAEILSEEDSRERAEAVQAIGIVHTNIAEYPLAIERLTESLRIAERLGDSERRGSIHNSLGVAYDSFSDFTRALEHYHHSEQLYESIGDRKGICFAINNLGTLYLTLNDLARAYEQFLRNKVLIEEIGDEWFRLVNIVNLASARHRLGETDSLPLFLESLELSRTLDALGTEAYALNSLGQYHMHREEYRKALEYFQEGAALTERIEDPMRWEMLTAIGEVYLRMKAYDHVATPLHFALEEVRTLGMRQHEFVIHELLSRYYEETGDMTLALHHHKLHTTIREEVAGQEQQRAMMNLEMRSEIARAERERELIRLEKEALQREMEQKQKELSSLALHLVEKNQFLDALKKEMAEVAEDAGPHSETVMRGLIRQVDGNRSSRRDWKAFEAQFEQVHNDFLKRLALRAPSLTAAELKVAALLKLNMSNKEIADLLSASDRTIGNHRYHIRKKLQLSEDVNLASYFTAL